MVPKRPQYDPQHSFDNAQQQTSQGSRRPRFDPQNSHDDNSSPPKWQRKDRQPTIPAPHFTSFDVDSALPPIHREQEPLFTPQHQTTEPSPQSRNRDNERYYFSQPLHQPTISPVGPIEQDLWTSDPRPWDSQAAYVPSPEQQHAALVHQEGQSTSTTTNLSSSTVGKSTPESNHTSSTSYRDNEKRVFSGKEDQQGGDDSFYWHSGRSSSDVGEEYSQYNSPVATPGESSMDKRSSATNSTVVQHEHHELPIRSTSLSPSISSTYGASALGFGGPSDWEYFGDYEAEEIDDEELYRRPRPLDGSNTLGGSAELPVGNPSAGETEQHVMSTRPTSESVSHDLPPLPERSSIRQSKSGLSSESVTHDTTSPEQGDYANDTEAVELNPATPHPFSSEPTPSSSIPADQRPDLDEVIRAWSEAPYVGRLKAQSSPLQDQNNHHEQPSDAAVASLASTPREKMLNANILSKDAPLLLPLPTSIDHLESKKERAWRSRDPPIVTPNTSPMLPASGTHQSDMHLAEQQVSVPDNLHEHVDTTLAKDSVFYPTQKNDKALSGDGEPLQDGLVVSSSPPNATPTKPARDRRSPVRPDSVTSLGERPSKTDDLVSNENPQVALPTVPQAFPSPSSIENPTQVVQLEAHGNVLQNARSSPIRESSEDVPQNISHEPMSSEPALPTLIRHQEKDSPATSINSHQTPSTGGAVEQLKATEDVPYKTSLEKSQATANLGARNIGSQEASITSQMNETLGNLSAKGAPTETSETTEPPLAKGDATKRSDELATSKVSSVGLQLSYETTSNNGKNNDPYADLDPWGKASLNRFAAMLREESRAETNKDKLNIFNVFTSRESRLRVVLYGTEDELVSLPKKTEQKLTSNKEPEAAGTPDSKIAGTPEKNGFVKNAVQRANTMSLQRSLKALPALPANRDSVIGLPTKALAPLVIHENSKPVVDHESAGSQSPLDTVQYSPGGRPIVTRILRENEQSVKEELQKTESPSETTAGAKDYHSRSSNAPIALGTEASPEVAKKFDYAPLKYREPRSEVKNYLANRKSVIRPYATLTQGSLENGSTFGRVAEINGAPSLESAVAVPTSQYNSVSKPNNGDALDQTMKPTDSTTGSKPDLRQFVKADFDPLVTILPAAEVVAPAPTRLDDLQNVVETIPDDFSFIHQSVVAWDAKAKKQREENDRQRHARQIESEQKIDSLFDDHEIGYGDISELESEFKRSEAARKADEDRSEYQLFVSDVFTLVWTRLHYELDQLIPHYEQYSSLMNDTVTGRNIFEESCNRLALAPTMSLFLTLHQKVEIRHQKAFEAVLERDRRLKKTEISPWYTLSNIAKVKQLEKQFEDAEKKAIIEYCQQRASRANRLMDVLDHNTLRGVGANQDYMEAIWKAVQRIASGRAFASMSGSNEPTAGMEEVEKARTITSLLATSSEQIVQTFHVADMLLNSADYEVSVARAKVTDKADKMALLKLSEERAKEDQKLMRDLEHRLVLIREATRRTNDEIVKLMLFLGVTNGRADSAPLTHAEPADDPGHKARIQKALEEAKRRNALKESGG